MKIAIEEIIIKKRVRRDLGNMDTLIQSFKKHGQLQPVIITRKKELIAGYRRIQAAKAVGWVMIDAIVVDKEHKADKLELELEENLARKDFNDEELYEGFRRLENLRKDNIFKRIWKAVKSFFGWNRG
jgi:ParB family chromosome partitioning protein